MKIETQEHDNHIVLKMEGSVSIENIHIFEEHLMEAVSRNKHILMDLTEVAYIDSISLGVIILNAKEAEKNGKRLFFINPNKDISQMFTITGLDRRLDIVTSLEEALDDISEN
jgi:anti-anti-sigma factor